MKKLLLILIALIFAANIFAADDEKKYGKDLTINEVTKVSAILETPGEYEGKKVLVEGTIVGVCAKAGCWIDIASDKEFEKIRIKVSDGEIVFPMEAKGKIAKVEGEVFSVIVTPESCEGEGGEKKCSGKEEDKCKAKHPEGGKKVYLIKGLGAVVYTGK